MFNERIIIENLLLIAFPYTYVFTGLIIILMLKKKKLIELDTEMMKY